MFTLLEKIGPHSPASTSGVPQDCVQVWLPCLGSLEPRCEMLRARAAGTDLGAAGGGEAGQGREAGEKCGSGDGKCTRR